MTFRDIVGSESAHSHDGGDISGQMPFVRVVAGVNIPALASRVAAGPRGFIDEVNYTDSTGSSAASNLPGLTYTFDSSRRYKITVTVPHVARASGSGIVIAWLQRDGSDFERVGVAELAAAQRLMSVSAAIPVTDSGEHTYRVRVARASGDVEFNVRGDLSPVRLYLEDIGAV